MIDLEATKKNLLDAGYTIAGWARAHSLNGETVKMFFYGKFTSKSPSKGVYGDIVRALRKSKLLVPTSPVQKAA